MKVILSIIIMYFSLIFISCNEAEPNGPPDNTQTDEFSPNETITDGNIIVYNFEYYNMTVVSVPDTVHYLYTFVNSKTIDAIGREGDWRYLINASFIDGSYSNAKHVGWLWIYGDSVAQAAVDQQLTHIVSINRKTREVKYAYYKDFVPPHDNNWLEIQTGPLVVDNSKLADTYINSSVNGLRGAKRTLLASTDNKQLYFIIVRKYADLISLGNYLLKLSIFQNKRLDAIDLDGGPSTALYSKNYSKLNFNYTAQLPVLLGIR